jgi:hypothetical protein
MKIHTFYYGQIVTESDLNDGFTWVQNAEKSLAKDIAENGVFDGLLVTPTSPVSTSVEVSDGVGRIVDDGSRVYNSATQIVPCTVDEFGVATFTDLIAGEGRWCSIYAKFKSVNSDLKTDGHGLPVWFTTSESVEFFLHLAPKGLIINKTTLPRPGTIPTAILLADIWFEFGSLPIIAGHLETTRREDYYRQIVSGIEISAGSPKATLPLLGSAISAVTSSFTDPDLPTGAADGAHSIGLGGTASLPQFQWAGGNFLDSFGDNVHMTLEKIVSDLGNLQTSGSSGSHLISHNITMTWFGGVAPTDFDSSIGGALEGTIFDLSKSVGVSGADLVGSSLVAGAPYALAAASIQTQLVTLLGDLNNHVNTAGHASNAITCAATIATWADGSWLASQNLLQRFESLVSVLGQMQVALGPTGAGLIGCGLTSQSHSTETLSWPGNVSVNDKFIAVANSVVHRVSVDGDTRLAGNFNPLANLGASLGTLVRQFQNVYVENIGGGDFGATSPIYLVSDYNLELYAHAGCTIVWSLMGAVDRIMYDGASLSPAAVASIFDIGTATNSWRDIYLSEVVNFTSPNIRYKTFKACSGSWADTAAASMAIAANGEYVSNGAIGTRSYHSLDFIKVGMTTSSIEIEWFPTVIANMVARILRTVGWMGGPPVLFQTINPTAAARHITIAPCVITGNNDQYILEMQYNVAIGQRFYGFRITHTSATLDY